MANPRKLLEDIPNKTRNALGILTHVALIEDGDGRFIRITIPANSYPISCNGKYYIRSGSTTQELTGRSLDEFILRKQGKTWDGVPVPNVTIDAFDRDAFNLFRKKAVAAARMNEEDLRINDALLLDNLRLMDSGYMKRAALLLFHQEPERWFTGAFVKIGLFRNAADLESQDEVHGPLIAMPDKVVDLVYLKYFKGKIAYSGIQRTETYPIPRPAFREAILNAIVHKDYSTGNPVHIHIYPDKVLIYNDGRLPKNWTEADLFAPHTSKPFNPDIANGFFRAGLIEAWGRGIEKIREGCRLAGISPPHYKIKPNEVMIGFEASIGDNIGDGIGDGTDGTEVGTDGTENENRVLAMIAHDRKITFEKLSQETGFSRRTVSRIIKSLQEHGKLKRIGSARSGHWEILQ
ncbi:transcriptional regulator [Planctomycetales bacterium]|nr:transcriptional regulator [Planctomycetales bacterium]